MQIANWVTGNLATRYKFTGREYDDFTGLHYYRARWYDGNLGRFISEDPIGFAGGDVNLYGYVGNGPVNSTDPSGLIDPSVYQAPSMYNSGGFANAAEFADSMDRGLDGVENSIGFDPIIGYSAIPIYNEGLRVESVHLIATVRGAIDMLRVGRGIGQALYCEGIDGWERAIYVAEDITRGASLFVTLAGPVAGKTGTNQSASRSVPALDEQASALVRQNQNRNSVTIRTPTQQIRYDLV